MSFAITLRVYEINHLYPLDKQHDLIRFTTLMTMELLRGFIILQRPSRGSRDCQNTILEPHISFDFHVAITCHRVA
jgi:hypothetical protein